MPFLQKFSARFCPRGLRPRACCLGELMSYRCVVECTRVYVSLSVCLSVRLCVDVDECSDTTDRCQPVGSCDNVPGSYRCSCPRGYKPDSSAASCQDVDECRDDQLCQYGCINLPGGYRCECPIGFVQHFYWNQCIGKY